MNKLELTKTQLWTHLLLLQDEEARLIGNMKYRKILRVDGKRSKYRRNLDEYESWDLAELKRVRLVERKIDKFLDP